ncbi:MAG: competence protein ComEC [Woeseiaceae bacterium]|jgi:competence protein ComEC
MAAICLCILLGAFSLELFPQLPPAGFLLLCVTAALLLLATQNSGKSRNCAAFIAGFALMWLASVSQMNERLDPSLAGLPVGVTGTVEDFPLAAEESIRFVFAPLQPTDLPGKIRLTWHDAKYLPSVGEVWHLNVRLQRPRGLSNPNGFDFAGWLFRQNIGATGYIVEDTEASKNRRVLSIRPDLPTRVRQRFVDRVSELLPADKAAAVLLAIGVGARHRISREDWDEYAATGTSHLMAISGLHIGLAAGSFFWLSWILLALICKRVNARVAATIVAVVVAGAYAELSGFAVPARRAFFMAIFLAIFIASRRRVDSSFVLAATGLTIFILDPLSILTPGFRMSFAAVAIIYVQLNIFRRRDLIFGSRIPAAIWSYPRNLVHIQLALLAGLFPLSVLMFDRFAAGAPLVNLLVLPVFSFVSVPFCLFGILFDGPLQIVGDLLLTFSYQSIALVLAVIARVAEEPALRFDIAALNWMMIAVVILPTLYVLLPAGWPGRKVVCLAMLAVVVYKPPAPPAGCLDYTILDVGQGLAVVLQTARHTVLFDTGPAFRGGSNMAQLAVLPFLRSRGIERIDKLLVSHADLDHSGGLQEIMSRIDVGEILAGEDPRLPMITARPCRAGVKWQWNGVRFALLHPRNRAAWQGNNLSCVLLVSLGRQRMLFTGDVESPVETLLAYRGVWPQVDVVLVPHHGSKTSSTEGLVRALSANLAIVSSGHNNRWGLPREEIVDRWQKYGARILNTANSGAVSQRLCTGLAATQPGQEGIDSLKYWHDPPLKDR